jgi:hypothetical protein
LGKGMQEGGKEINIQKGWRNKITEVKDVTV